MKEEIAILLAAYNGEQYIREMIESILKQKTEAMLRATGAFKDYKIGYEGLSMEEM